MQSNNELYHYGIKGMKWGVRKQEKINTLQKTYRSKASTAKTHYAKAQKYAEKVKSGEFSKKETKQYKAMGAHQYAKGEKYNKEALKIQKKIKRNGGTVPQSSALDKSRIDAGKYYVKKSLARRVAENSMDAISIGAQFAIETALLGKPVAAIGTTFSPYKMKLP